MQEEAIFYHEEINESHAENSSPETTHSPHYCLKVVIINVMKMMMRRINDQGIVIVHAQLHMLTMRMGMGMQVV